MNLLTLGRVSWCFQEEAARYCGLETRNACQYLLIPLLRALWISLEPETRTRPCPHHSRRAAPEKVCRLWNESLTKLPSSCPPRGAAARPPASASVLRRASR